MADFDCIEKPYKCKCIGPAVVCMASALEFKDTIQQYMTFLWYVCLGILFVK